MTYCKKYRAECNIQYCSAKLPGSAAGQPFKPCVYQSTNEKAMTQISLRPQLDRSGRWKIEKRASFKWLRFGGVWYWTRSDAQDAIDRLVQQFPDEYTTERQ